MTPRHPKLGDPVAVYQYQRASGDVAFVVCRFEPKDFRSAQQKDGRWSWSIKSAPKLLYRLPEVEQALAEGRTVWVVDGEKDADALAAAGECATCCARAQSWTIEHSEQLTGARRVRVVVDRDNGVGAKQARQVARSLVDNAGVASIDIEFVQAAEGKDAADHLAAGRSLDEFELVELAAGQEGGGRRFRPRALSGVVPRKVHGRRLRRPVVTSSGCSTSFRNRTTSWIR
jgi:hypothetical protein